MVGASGGRSLACAEWRRSAPSVGSAERRLAAVLAADVAGYGRLIELDDVGTVLRLRTLRQYLIEPMAASGGALTVRYAGDGILMAFAEPADAAACAAAIQRGLHFLEAGVPEERRIRLRIGISFGPVLLLDDDLYGIGVNLAARLEALAEPGTIYLCDAVFEQAQDTIGACCEPLGERWLKNMAAPVRVYRIAAHDLFKRVM